MAAHAPKRPATWVAWRRGQCNRFRRRFCEVPVFQRGALKWALRILVSALGGRLINLIKQGECVSPVGTIEISRAALHGTLNNLTTGQARLPGRSKNGWHEARQTRRCSQTVTGQLSIPSPVCCLRRAGLVDVQGGSRNSGDRESMRNESNGDYSLTFPNIAPISPDWKSRNISAAIAQDQGPKAPSQARRSVSASMAIQTTANEPMWCARQRQNASAVGLLRTALLGRDQSIC